MADLFAAVTLLEAIAVAFAVAYLVLAIRQVVWCWLAAFIGSVLSIFVFAAAQLYMQSALQVFYAAMAIYGWRQWTRRNGHAEPALRVHTWPLRRHLTALICVAAASGLFAWGLSYSDQALPLLDSFVTVAAMLTTWMIAHKLLENWIYWFVIDSISIYLYVAQELMLYAALFGVYLVLVVIGFRRWLADLSEQARSGAAVSEPS